MSSDRERSGDQVYHDEDVRYEESPAEAHEDESRFPYFPAAPWGWWPSLGWRGSEEEYEAGAHQEGVYGDETYEERAYEEDTGDRSGIARLWDEGLITLLIVGGAVLFLFPEPATSGLGALLMGIGVIAWLVDWAT